MINKLEPIDIPLGNNPGYYYWIMENRDKINEIIDSLLPESEEKYEWKDSYRVLWHSGISFRESCDFIRSLLQSQQQTIEDERSRIKKLLVDAIEQERVDGWHGWSSEEMTSFITDLLSTLKEL